MILDLTLTSYLIEAYFLKKVYAYICNPLYYFFFKGFNTKIWNAFVEHDGVCFTYLSKDGEEGYPG